jgi:hypothetical protein
MDYVRSGYTSGYDCTCRACGHEWFQSCDCHRLEAGESPLRFPHRAECKPLKKCPAPDCRSRRWFREQEKRGRKAAA